jgi:hypothetical protein
MMRIIGWCVAAGTLAIIFVNGVFMLVSPRAWFHLPRLIRLNGTLTEGKYTDGRGGLQVRILGAVTTGFIAWLAYSLVMDGGEISIPFISGGVNGKLQVILWCLYAFVGLLITANGIFMLASPRAWSRLPPWIRVGGLSTLEEDPTRMAAAQIRLTGAVILAAIAWVLYEMLLRRG